MRAFFMVVTILNVAIFFFTNDESDKTQALIAAYGSAILADMRRET